MQNPATSTLQSGADLIATANHTMAALGKQANALLFQIEFSAMGSATLGARGLQIFGSFVKSV